VGKPIEVKFHSGENGRIEYGKSDDCPKKCFEVLDQGQVVNECVFYKRKLKSDECNQGD
jgi:hypothetical protein